VIRPDLLELRELNVEIDRESELCRGRTVVDVWKRTGREANARVAVGIDAPGFIELLLERLGSLDRDAERRD
jgi:purine nucleosidase